MKYLLIIVFLLFPVIGWANPFLVCDPYPTTVTQPTEFRISYGTVTVTSPAVATTGGVWLHWDLVGLAAGTYNISVVAVTVDPIWGDSVSAAVPFTFTKPVQGTVPTPANIKLSK